MLKGYIGATIEMDEIGKTGDPSLMDWITHPGIAWGELNRVKENRANFEKNLPTVSAGVKNWEQLSSLLAQAGITGDLNSWAAATALFETGNLTSNPTKWYNYSNIAYTPHSPYQSGKGYKDWAAYRTPLDWAKDMRRVLSLRNVKTSVGPGGPPAIDATSLPDYVERLRANGYFGNGNPSLYLRGLDLIVKSHAGYKQDVAKYEHATDTKVDIQKGTISPQDWWHSLSGFEKVGVGVGVGLLALVVVKNVTR